VKKDNTTLERKTALRLSLLRKIPNPVILETHGGVGQIWKRMYSEIPQGVVFEEKPAKAEKLANQRPTWAVYESDCVRSLRAGIGAHLNINFIDLDPYGEPWPALEAIFASERPWPARLGIVVNDGLRMKCKLTGGWDCESLRPAVRQFGNSAMYPEYLKVARWNLERITATRGYRLTDWAGYYCGHHDAMTHYAAVLDL
jgi:hypothetical protein